MIVIRGTKELLEEFYGKTQKETLRTLIIMGDKPLAVIGLKIQGSKMVVFTDCKDELREHKSFKRMVIKAMREFYKILPNMPVYAKADPKIKGSESLLIHAGFEQIGDVWLIR